MFWFSGYFDNKKLSYNEGKDLFIKDISFRQKRTAFIFEREI